MAEAIETYKKFAPILESLDRNILFVASTLESILNLTNGMFEIQNKQLVLAEENAERLRRREELEDLERPEPPAPPPPPGDSDAPKIEEGEPFSFSKILGALALAPFAFKFAKGFVEAITDELVDITASGITGLAAMIKNPINSAFTKIANTTSKFAKMLTSVGKFISTTFNALPGSGILKTLLGRLAWPITLVLGMVDAVKEFMDTEGNLIEKLGEGLGAFASTVVGAPLDLVKSAVAWIVDKLGFESFADTLREFNFSDLIRNIFTSMFDGVQGAVNVITDLFEFGEEDKGALGALGKLTDLVYAPVNMAIGFVRGLFGFEDNGEPFKLQDFIAQKVTEIIGWVEGIFSWASSGIAEGWTNLTTKVSDVWSSISSWFNKLFEWSSAGIAEGWTNLTTKVSDVWSSISSWFASKFSWEAISDEWTNLTSLVSGVWTDVKTWFTDNLAFSADGEDFSIKALFDTAIENIKTFFTDLFDFLPSIDDIKNSLKSALPSWLGGTESEEDTAAASAAARAELETQIENLRNEQSSAPTTDEANQMMEYSGKTKEEYDADIRRLEEQLANLPQAKRGGIINAPKTGTPVMLHGQEAIIPLDSSEGQTILERKTGALEQSSAALSSQPAPVLVTGGNVNRAGDTYNNGGNTNNTTIINNVIDAGKNLNHVPQ